MDELSNDGDRPGELDPLQVSLPNFDGPLDLLLHLVRKQELNINELRLADLTEPYLAHVTRMQALNLDVGGEFLVIAATLIWIKSKTLLPVAPAEDELPPETLEEMLLLRLQEYQQFRGAAFQLAARPQLGREIFPRQAPASSDPAPEGPPEFEEVSLFGLIEAFRSVLERSERDAVLHLDTDPTRVEDSLESVLRALGTRRALYFHELFEGHKLSGGKVTRREVIVVFISLLELIRLGVVRVVQAEPQGQIRCLATDRLDAGDQDWKALALRSIYGEPEPTPHDGNPAAAAPGA